ncbi:DUF6768 family protein [Polaribacter sp. SA4-12]|uniref:DUF6768 family protein n=1 Tax=Polaribacter sp. SA4-12 TaxID=1312072 RepID=UPI000B3BE3EC|nr:DUF6768 family protein [Polaribacter sp. SA4-12]ARV14621.1 hypothetical protein BTO07_05405 [Polaribacter sp. SA4-12]
MKDNIEEIDQLIKETLTQEESKFYDGLEEQDLFASVKGLFNGKLKWMISLLFFVNFIILGFLIYSMMQFFEATTTFELIKWAAASFLCILMMSMLKLFSWMQMNKNALLREIKRLELLMISSQKK